MHRCDFLQFLVHFYSQVLLIESFNFNFSSQYVLLGLTSCDTSSIMYYTVILCYKLAQYSWVQHPAPHITGHFRDDLLSHSLDWCNKLSLPNRLLGW